MADFQQTYGFDARQAIAELARLERAAAMADRTVTRLMTEGKTGGPDFARATKSAKNFRAEAIKAADGVRKGLGGAENAVDSMTLSWQTMARVVQTQLIIRSLNALRDLFFESADAAQEFQLQVARIQQIASGASFSHLSDEVRQLALELGRPLMEVGEAVFESLQNDLGDLDETINLLRTDAHALALVTGGTLPQAVNALSSVIKAYNLDIAEAEGLSDIFFQTIDSGRVTLEELENSLGNVLPLSAQVGVSHEEVAAAIASVTLSGVKASRAMTQLRNIFQKGIRPTEKMNETLEKLGVETFAQLVEESGGLQQTLQALSDAVDGDAEQLSEMFNTIRGGLGVFNLLAHDSQEFIRVLGEVETSGGRAADAVASINETDAREAQLNAARLEVLIADLGNTALKAKTEATALFLGIVPDAQAAATAMTAAGTAATVFGVKAVVSIKGVQAALATLGPVAAAIGIALVTAFAVDQTNRYFRSLQEVNSELVKTGRHAAKVSEEMRMERLRDDTIELTDTFRRQNVELQGFIGFAQREYDNLQKSAADTNRVIEQLGADALTRFSNTTDGIIDGIRKAIDSIPGMVRSATAELQGIRADIEDVTFEQGLRGLDAATEATRRMARASQLLQQAREAASGGGLGEDSQRETKLAFDRADAAQRLAQRAAERAGDARLISQAERQQLAVLRAQEHAVERRRDALAGLNKGELREQFLRGRQINEEEKERIKNIQELMRTFESSGAPKTTEKIAEDTEKAQREFEKLQDNMEEFANLEVVELFGFQDLANEAKGAIEQGLVDASIDWSNSIKTLKDQLSSETFEAVVRLLPVLDAPTGASGLDEALASQRGVDPVEQLKAQQNALENFQREQISLQGDHSKATRAVRDAIADTQEATDAARVQNFWGAFTQGANEARSAANRIDEQLKRVPEAGREEIAKLRDNFRLLKGVLDSLVDDDVVSEVQQTRIREALFSLFDAIDARAEQVSLEEILDDEGLAAARAKTEELGEAIRESLIHEAEIDDSQVDGLNQKLDATKTKADNARDGVSAVGPAASGANGSVSSLSSTTGGLASRANTAAAAFRRMESAAIAAAQAAAAAASAGGGGFAYHGGQVNYRANGGFSGRGHDTQLTATQPGEFIVNSKQSRNFFSQLHAINSGSAPSPSESGTTNINIGDVNVTSSAQIPGDTARDIGRSLKREIRKKAFTL